MADLPRGGFRYGSVRPWSRDFFRIVSWNIERGLQFPKILDFLRAIDADLLLLQEVDLNARRTRFRDVAGELAQALNFNYVFGIEFEELSEGTAANPAYHGMATLSPWPLSNARIIRFQTQSTFWKPRWYIPELAVFQRRIGGRIALVVEAAVYRVKVVTYNLHLESRVGDDLRVRQLNEVLADCRTHAERTKMVIAGDFNLNAGVGDAAEALGGAGFHDALRSHERPAPTTHGPSHHTRAIDWIFVSDPPLDSQGKVHNDVRASDHYPISVTFARP